MWDVDKVVKYSQPPISVISWLGNIFICIAVAVQWWMTSPLARLIFWSSFLRASLRNMLCIKYLQNSFWSRRIYNLPSALHTRTHSKTRGNITIASGFSHNSYLENITLHHRYRSFSSQPALSLPSHQILRLCCRHHCSSLVTLFQRGRQHVEQSDTVDVRLQEVARDQRFTANEASWSKLVEQMAYKILHRFMKPSSEASSWAIWMSSSCWNLTWRASRSQQCCVPL